MVTQNINISTNTPTVFQFERTSIEKGIHKNGGNTQMVVEKTGIYEVWYSIQLHSTVSQDIFSYIWLRVNGQDVLDSNGRVETKSNTSDSLPIVPYILNLNAGDTVSFVGQTSASANTDVQAFAVTGVPGPDIPSIIVGIKQIASDIGTTGPTGIQGPKGSLDFTGPTGAILYFNGTSVTGTANFTYTPGGSGMYIDGNILPSQNNTFSLGLTGMTWKEINLGPGTINMGGTGGNATLGLDQNSIMYSQYGFATPFINIGPEMDPLNPGAIGGWVIGPTGAYGTADYDLIARLKLEGLGLPAGLTGPTYSLIKRVGPTGPRGVEGITGAHGPTGPPAIAASLASVSYILSANQTVQSNADVLLQCDTIDANQSIGIISGIYNTSTYRFTNTSTTQNIYFVNTSVYTGSVYVKGVFKIVKNGTDTFSNDYVEVYYAQESGEDQLLLSAGSLTRVTITQLDHIQGPTGPTGLTGAAGAGPTGLTGFTGPQGPTGQIAPYQGTSYRDTTTLTFVQNNGTVYYAATLTATKYGIANYNELGTMLNVPNVKFTYMAIIYSYDGNPGDVQFGVVDFSTPVVILHNTTLNIGGVSTNIDNPSIVEYTFPTAITTTTARPLRIAVWGGNFTGSNHVHIRTVILGFN
jgi:hypothetical protein